MPSLAVIAAQQPPALALVFSKTWERLPPSPENKSVTRRIWAPSYAKAMLKYLNAGRVMPAFKKSRRSHGEQVGWSRWTNLRQEPLSAITPDECRLEGFPELSPEEFLGMFFPAHPLDTIVWRGVFDYEYLEEE